MKKKVYAYVHTHWDREWYREFDEFRVRLNEVFNDVLAKLQANELDSFYFDGQTSALEDYLQINPENENIIKQLIKDKRLYIGPYFCSTDSFLVDSESLIKNLQIGIEYSKTFGCTDYIAYHADTFGHSAHIPQIIKYFNIPNAVFWRGLGELESEFLFNGLKSTYLIEGYFHDYLSAPVSYEKKAEFLKRTLDRIAKYSSDSILLPLGADHLAAPDNIKEQIRELNKRLDDYEIILSTPFEYLEKVKNNYKKNIKHEFRDTKRNFILPGVLSSRIDLKQQNAKLQWELSRITQPLQAITSFLGKSANFQKEINNAYKELIKNHAHDSIYGCSTDNVHKENKNRFKRVSQACHAILNSVRRDLYNEDELSVINLSGNVLNGALKLRTDKKLSAKYNAQLISRTKGFPLTKLYAINQIPITEDYTDIYEYLVDLKNIPAYSIQNIKPENIQTSSSLKIAQNSIENDKISLCVKNGQIIISDKINNKEYKDFIKFIDRADIGDSYNFGALKNDRPVFSKIIRTKIKESGKIRSILEIVFELLIPAKSGLSGRSKKIKKHCLSMQAILENQNDRIEFKIDWKNQSTDHLLQVEFNMKEPVKETISDDLAGYLKRQFDTDYDIYKHIPAPRGIELKHNTAPLQKCLFAQGLCLTTEGLQEYEIYKNKLRLTILRATGTISNPVNPTRGTPAGPPLPTPDLQMQGANTARFTLCFKDTIQEAETCVEKFYGAALLLSADLIDTKLFEINSKEFKLSTIKLDKDDNLVLRFLNKSDKEQLFDFNTELQHSNIYITDAMEQEKKEFAPTKIEPNSFVTLIIKNN